MARKNMKARRAKKNIIPFPTDDSMGNAELKETGEGDVTYEIKFFTGKTFLHKVFYSNSFVFELSLKKFEEELKATTGQKCPLKVKKTIQVI